MTPSREDFIAQCKRRFGATNPERMRLAHWEWMVRHREDPFRVRESLGLEQNFPACCGPDGCGEVDPDWCFIRFGMSRTRMSNGRIICIAGEHEDFYDPDFCIYNDVVVLRPPIGDADVSPDRGEVEIYGYPTAVFPPTDFHSATLIGDRLVMIGRLGYANARCSGLTPVVTLDTRDYRIEPVDTAGQCPGWIYGHHASFEPARNALLVRGGRRHVPGAASQVANHAAHRLHLDGMRWELIDQHEPHRRFILAPCNEHKRMREELRAEHFRPRHVAHEVLEPEDRGIDVYPIDVTGVRVTFEDRYDEICIRVEGRVAEDLLLQVLRDVCDHIGEATGWDWDIREIQE